MASRGNTPETNGGTVTAVEIDEQQAAYLTRVLTPDFLRLNPDSFIEEGVPEVAHRATPERLRGMLIDVSGDGTTAVRYFPPKGGGWLAATPTEVLLFGGSIPQLAKKARSKVLESRDQKLREETQDSSARARGPEDLAAANRRSVRLMLEKRDEMQDYDRTQLEPRVDLIKRFVEMTEHRTLTRGTDRTVRKRLEELRNSVFGDMLDAIGNQEGWDVRKQQRAQRLIQWRLYIGGTKDDRVANFTSMLGLADEYYALKRYWVAYYRLGQANTYLARHKDVVEECRQLDVERLIQKHFGDAEEVNA